MFIPVDEIIVPENAAKKAVSGIYEAVEHLLKIQSIMDATGLQKPDSGLTGKDLDKFIVSLLENAALYDMNGYICFWYNTETREFHYRTSGGLQFGFVYDDDDGISNAGTVFVDHPTGRFLSGESSLGKLLEDLKFEVPWKKFFMRHRVFKYTGSHNPFLTMNVFETLDETEIRDDMENLHGPFDSRSAATNFRDNLKMKHKNIENPDYVSRPRPSQFCDYEDED